MGDLPSTIGPYRIVRPIGQGGMGAVFEGIHQTIDRRVAIKVLHPEYARSADMAKRFINEARAVNQIEHPGLVQISDYGQLLDGTAYIVMEYLKGQTLSHRIEAARDKLAPGEVLQICWQLADSLAAAHEKGIIHRDLKPGNVMLVPDPHMPIGERTKLLDFGLAKVTQGGGTSLKTRSDVVMGTPLYMSPEQCEGAGRVDAKSDVYALGVMLYQMLCGQPPFVGDGPGQVLGMHMYQLPEPLRNRAPSVPEPVAKLVHRLLSKNREQRPTMQQVAQELEGLFKLVPPSARRASLNGNAQHPRDAAADDPEMALASTLGHSASQRRPALTRRRWSVVAAVLVAGALGIGVATTRQRTLLVQPAIEPHAKEPAPHRVIWQIATEPAGADIVRTSDGQVLGQTPWRAEQDAASGQLMLRLRRAGFAEREIVIDRGADAIRQERLTPQPLATPAQPHPSAVKLTPRATGLETKRSKTPPPRTSPTHTAPLPGTHPVPSEPVTSEKKAVPNERPVIE